MAGVKVFITYRGRFLLLLRDNNPDIPSPNCWSLVGGGIEPGETPEQALIREAQEEAGITLKNPLFLFHLPERELTLYHVELQDDDIPNIRLGDEGQDLQFFNFEDMSHLKLSEQFRDYFEEYKDIIRQLV